MSVNRHRPHVYVLPEDGANRQLANGFVLGLDQSVQRRIQVLREVGGWRKVLDCFESDHTAEMNRFTGRFMVLLLDFDGDVERVDLWRRTIPANLAARVFVLGVLSEPEELKKALLAEECEEAGKDLGTYEKIGEALASECRDDTAIVWEHALLRHNAAEVVRLREHIRPILF